MGNRAVITASKDKDKGQGIYLHWDGSLSTVLAYLDTARSLKYRDPAGDESYAMARLCGLICLLSPKADTGIGIGDLSQLDCDNYDNGVYVIGGNWEIIDRWGEGSAPVTHAAVAKARTSEGYRSTVEALISAVFELTGVHPTV